MLKKINMSVFGKSEEIARNALMFYTKSEPLIYSLSNIHDACKSLFKRQWMYVQETGKELTSQPFLKDFHRKSGYIIPGNCFSCLLSFTEFKVKVLSGEINEEDYKPCDLCRTKELGCNEERGLYRQFISSNKRDKKILAGIIKNTWK